MYLLILDSIGTSELILIGIVALIFLGPRRMPEIARKMGKMMAELRSATTEFKQTWEREVDFEADAAALRDIDSPPPATTSEQEPRIGRAEPPMIKPAEPSAIENLKRSADRSTETVSELPASADPADKRSWL